MKSNGKIGSRLYYSIGAGACLLMAFGCSKDGNPLDGGCNTSWSQRVSNEQKALVNAATAYASDATSANCRSYRSAAQNYLNALEKARPCVIATNQAEFDQALDDAKESLAELTCE